MNIFSVIFCVQIFFVVVVDSQEPNEQSSSESSSATSSSSSSSSSSSPNNQYYNLGSSRQKHEEEYIRVTLPTLGTLQGVRGMGLDFFGGIPFAAPPVGNLRWAPPEEPVPWKPHTLDATQFGPDCHQIHDPINNALADEHQMSEDCLYLNVYSPAGSSSIFKKQQGPINYQHNRQYHYGGSNQRKHNKNNNKERGLPVLVWFHGGAFQQGAAKRPEYDGRRLAQEEMVVVVTVNYRLGALGWMCKSDLGLYGNYGLMDQRAALYWVQEHIQVFGGNPNSVTVFGESAGAISIGLHLQMTPTLFHRAILQSVPMGYQFRSVVVADFLGDAIQRAVDCNDLECLRSEPVSEIMRAQSSLMGIPRSVGDFFAWGPVLTLERHVFGGGGGGSGRDGMSQKHSLLQQRSLFYSSEKSKRESSKFIVNVTQPLLNLHKVPDSIPIIIGTNRHEGEMFVHSAFPLTMSKPVYWMFVGALFKDSAARVLRHYRSYVAQLEAQAGLIAEDQLTEEENRQYYMDHSEDIQRSYQKLMQMNENNSSQEMDYEVVSPETIEQLVKTFNAGGDQAFGEGEIEDDGNNYTIMNDDGGVPWWKKARPPPNPFRSYTDPERADERRRRKLEKQAQAKREKALKEAATVGVDYRPVMSEIINDYLFRCPSWHYAHQLSRNRVGHNINNVFVYRFSQPTHIPGFKECWGKSCHTSELPYVFQSMDVIRTNYSTLSEIAQREAPSAPSYPYTEMLDVYRDALARRNNAEILYGNGTISQQSTGGYVSGKLQSSSNINNTSTTTTASKSFQKIMKHFFDDYFMVDADEETASDMAQRWVAFARSGDPNYDDSKIQWMPWRYIAKEEEEINKNSRDFESYMSWAKGEEEAYDIWSDVEDEFWEENGYDRMSWSDVEMDLAYRRRALLALSMEVVEENELRSELRRTKVNEHDPDNAFFASKFLSKLGISWKDDDETGNEKKRRIPTSTIRQVQRIAQEMGVLGSGLQGDYDRSTGRQGSYWDDDFFPQLLELKWPPEGRLVERDCSCDFWERIRYRY